MRRSLVLAAAILFVSTAGAQPSRRERGEALPATADSYAALAPELDAALDEDVVGAWFPRSVDEKGGGFHANFRRDWSPAPDRGKSTVFQARMTWIAAQVAIRRPDRREEMLPLVRRGMDVLQSRLWDRERGGFYWLVDERGTPIDPPAYKHAYPQAFGIFAAAAAYEASRDPRDLDVAQRAFRWLDEHAHDAVNGGYFETLTLDGTPVAQPAAITPELMRHYSFYAGFKTSNAHIHLLEAFTQLARVWDEPLVRERLRELLAVVRDRFAVAPGCLHQVVQPDFAPLPDRASYGHDIEAAFLLLEAAEVLDARTEAKTLDVARSLVDHSLAFGFDEERGGLFEGGPALQQGRSAEKSWWPQMEALNSLLLMHELYGKQTGRYWRAFQLQWRFVRRSLLDPENHGTFEAVTPDGRGNRGVKGNEWKAAYHDGRAFLFCADRLRKLAGQ